MAEDKNAALLKIAERDGCTLKNRYTNNFTKLEIECNTCKNVWQEFNNIIVNSGMKCMRCKEIKEEESRKQYKFDIDKYFSQLRISFNKDVNVGGIIYNYGFETGNGENYLIFVGKDLPTYEETAGSIDCKYKCVGDMEELEQFLNSVLRTKDEIKLMEFKKAFDEDIEEGPEDIHPGTPHDPILAFFKSLNPKIRVYNREYELIAINDKRNSFITTEITRGEGRKVCCLYCRVSTREQAEHGQSFLNQIERLSLYAKAKNFDIKRFYIDAGISGKSTVGRSALIRMMDELKKDDTVIVYQISRFVRNIRDGIKLIDQIRETGAKFITLDLDIDTTTAIGEHQLVTFLSLAEMERKMTQQRVVQTLEIMKNAGTLRHKPTYGWKFVGKDRPYESVDYEQNIIAYIMKMKREGKSIHAIAQNLNLSGITPPKKSKSWWPSTVKRIIERCEKPWTA